MTDATPPEATPPNGTPPGAAAPNGTPPGAAAPDRDPSEATPTGQPDSGAVDPVQATAAAIGPWATAAEAFALLTVDVPDEHWTEALTTARDTLGLSYFDWLSAVDELAEGFSVVAHLAAVGGAARASGPPLRHLLLRTRIPREGAVLPTATGVFAGAGWHERETHEMFGIDFTGHPNPVTLLLPDGFEGYPLRKEFVLAARVAKAWPGAKEPGESDHGQGGEGAPAARRRMLPPGVPDPNEWGPLAGTLPPVAERPARGAARGPRAGAADPAGGAVAPGERAVRADRPRRNRSVGEGSASQSPASQDPEAREAPGPGPASGPAPEAPAPKPEAPAPTPDAPWQSVPPPKQDPPAGTGTDPDGTTGADA